MKLPKNFGKELFATKFTSSRLFTTTLGHIKMHKITFVIFIAVVAAYGAKISNPIESAGKDHFERG